jgi:SAM-dependent methyltransferase
VRRIRLSDPQIHVDLSALLAGNAPVVVDLGCGRQKRPGSIGIDAVDMPHVDIVADLNEGLPFLPDESVDAIYSDHFLEHVDRLELVVAEIARVLKRGACAHVSVPHFSNPYFYSDYTHQRFFGLYTFYYFVDEPWQLARKVPSFYTPTRIRVESQQLVFRPGTGRPGLYHRALNKLVNRSPGAQEFYEEHLCYLFPCYELRVVFTRADGEAVTRRT